MLLSLGLIHADILMARHGMDDFIREPKLKDLKNMSAYHLQQASEKLLKYQIYKLKSFPNNKEMYTHDLQQLIAYAKNEQLKIIVPDYVVRNAGIITDWEAGSRYRIGFSVRIDTLEKAYVEINEWFNVIKTKEKHASKVR